MKELFKIQLPYLLTFIILFYVIPLTYKLNVPKELAITMLLLDNPVVSLATSAVYGFKHKFKWYYLLFEPVLFIPSAYLFYNDSAIIYAALYEIFCLIGLGLGVIIGRGKSRQRQVE